MVKVFGGRLPPTIRQLLASSTSSQSQPPRVSITVWVKSVRHQKKVTFAAVNDGSTVAGLQAVFDNKRHSIALQGLSNGCAVQLAGLLTKSQGAGQEKELQVEEMSILGSCDPETYPIQKQALTIDYLRDNCHLRARVDRIGAMLRIRDRLTEAIHAYFKAQEFHHVHAPIVASNDCEGAGETFTVNPAPPAGEHVRAPATSDEGKDSTPSHFFGRPAYLTVSSQLHLEAFATALQRVYTLSPCFRAERSQTSRHLAEFWMLEAEWACSVPETDAQRRLGGVLDIVEGLSKTVVADALAQNEDDMNVLWKASPGGKQALHEAVDASQWARMSYGEAVRELARYHASKGSFQFEPVWGKPLQSEHEKWLAEQLIRGPVFVTDYPAALKPFYMRSNDDSSVTTDGETVSCFDLLIPGVGELVGGSLREERLELLDRNMDRHGLDKAQYGWYRDLRRFGGIPHGGFGMGFERLVAWVTGIENVRECIGMPRWAGRMLL